MLLDLDRKPHSLGDVTRVDRNGGRVPGGVAISSIQGCDQRGGKLQVRALESLICRGEVRSKLALPLVQAVQPLGSQGGREEKRKCPRRNLHVHEREEGDDRRIGGRCEEKQRRHHACGIGGGSPTYRRCQHCEPDIRSSRTIVATSVAATSPPNSDGTSINRRLRSESACRADDEACARVGRPLQPRSTISDHRATGVRDRQALMPPRRPQPRAGQRERRQTRRECPRWTARVVCESRTLTRSATAPARASASTVNGASSL